MAQLVPKEREGQPPSPAVVQIREQVEGALASGMWRTAPATEETTLGGVRVLRFKPSISPRATILHFHGGGFRLGRPELSSRFAAALVEHCAVEVVCPAYRLAPEHPFPAGLNDAHAAFTALERTVEGPLILSGDSAGGGLAASLTALVSPNDRVSALLMFSPWLDLTVSSPSYELCSETDSAFSRASAEQGAEAYLQGLPGDHPLASPLFGALEAFPPTFISVGTGEVLIEDARRFDAALQTAGVEAVLCAVPGMQHVAVVQDLEAPGAPETFVALLGFLQRHDVPTSTAAP